MQVQRPKDLGHPLFAFPGHKQKAALEVEQLEQELASVRDAGLPGGGLAYYATKLVPYFFKMILTHGPWM